MQITGRGAPESVPGPRTTKKVIVDCGGKVPITGETVKHDSPAVRTASVGAAAPSTTRSGALYVFQWNGSGSGELFATCTAKAGRRRPSEASERGAQMWGCGAKM